MASTTSAFLQHLKDLKNLIFPSSTLEARSDETERKKDADIVFIMADEVWGWDISRLEYLKEWLQHKLNHDGDQTKIYNRYLRESDRIKYRTALANTASVLTQKKFPEDHD